MSVSKRFWRWILDSFRNDQLLCPADWLKLYNIVSDKICVEWIVSEPGGYVSPSLYGTDLIELRDIISEHLSRLQSTNTYFYPIPLDTRLFKIAVWLLQEESKTLLQEAPCKLNTSAWEQVYGIINEKLDTEINPSIVQYSGEYLGLVALRSRITPYLGDFQRGDYPFPIQMNYRLASLARQLLRDDNQKSDNAKKGIFDVVPFVEFEI